jgi:hypothetical protein
VNGTTAIEELSDPRFSARPCELKRLLKSKKDERVRWGAEIIIESDQGEGQSAISNRNKRC